METFFALLQKNILNRQRWTTREELWPEIINQIERSYRRRRRQPRLGRLTPVEFETVEVAPQTALNLQTVESTKLPAVPA